MQRIAIALCAAVIAAAGGIAISKAGDSKVASASTTQQAMPGGGAPQGGGGPDLSALAKDLGVSESKLEQAMQDARPTSGQGFDPSEMAERLADALNLSTATVQKALDANRPDRGMGGGPPSGTVPPSGGTQSGSDAPALSES